VFKSRTPQSGLPPIFDGSDFATIQQRDLLYGLVLNNTIVGVCYMHERCLVWANARMAEIFGYEDGELTGSAVRMLYSSEKDYAEVGRRYKMFARYNSYTHERAMVKKNGDTLWCLISGRMIDPTDPHSPSVWVVQDITARKQAENRLKRANLRLEQAVERRTQNQKRTNEALHLEMERRRAIQAASVESRGKYRALFKHLPVGILVTGADGEIVEINSAMQRFIGAMTATSLAQVLDDSNRVVDSEDHACSLRQFVREKTPMDGRRVERSHMVWRSNIGKLAQFTMVATRLASHGLGAVFAFEDITAMRHARERESERQNALAHAMRVSMMGQFASSLAHELGQPLNACESYVAGIRYRFGDDLVSRPELQRALDQISRHLDQAGQIIRNVRRFVSHQDPEFDSIDARELVMQTLDLLRIQLRASSTRIEVEARDDLPPVKAHRIEVQQVVVNLIINAIEAMAGEATVRRLIRVQINREGRNMLCIQVSDNGPGVPSELIDRIFSPYFTTKKDGLGMGLMICRTIVESHSGAIRYASSPSAGGIFRFTLPVSR